MGKTATDKAAELQKKRDEEMMDRFDRMQATMTKALEDQTKNAMAGAAILQRDMLKDLIPQLLVNQPQNAARSGPNSLAGTGGIGSHSHTIPSTGLISASASHLEAQLPPLGHLTGDLSSGLTADDKGNYTNPSNVR
jgi:hypothetical protein